MLEQLLNKTVTIVWDDRSPSADKLTYLGYDGGLFFFLDATMGMTRCVSVVAIREIRAAGSLAPQTPGTPTPAT